MLLISVVMKNNKKIFMVIVVMLLLVSTLGTILTLLVHENKFISHLHGVFGGIMLVAVIIHIVQNWKWICACMFGSKQAANDKECTAVLNGVEK